MNTLATTQTRGPILIQKLSRAKSLYAQIVTLETQRAKTEDMIMRGAWELGGLLNDLKEEIGHGHWLIWLTENFRELGRTESALIKNAERCMTFNKRNPNSRNSTNFDDESKRKFQWGYIKVKERMQLEGDRKDAPATHYLTFVNNFLKWDRQVEIGQGSLPPVDVLRRELETPVRRIIALCGKEWVQSLL